jgi:enamine deaminase RidA (YjgF/YER057c/UK114 family)
MSRGEPIFVLPQGWPRPKGFSNAVVLPHGRPLYVAGQIGWKLDGTFPEGFAAQFRQALLNIRACIEAAGGRVEHIGRVDLFVTSKAEYVAARKEIGGIWREVFGRHYPAMAMFEVNGLLEPRALLEIEATGVVADE